MSNAPGEFEPDWEEIARNALPTDIEVAGNRVAEDCRLISDIIREGRDPTKRDVQRLERRIGECRWLLDAWLNPLVGLEPGSMSVKQMTREDLQARTEEER